MNRKAISCDEIYHSYVELGMSAPEIARREGCSTETIYSRLRDCEIAIRKASDAVAMRRRLSLSREELQTLYIQEQLSIYEIGKKFNCSPTTIWKYLKKFKIEIRPIGGAIKEYDKRDFDGNLCDKAYLIGLRLGDLHVEKGSRAIRIRCTSTKKEQLDLIEKLFGAYGGVWISQDRKKRGKGITVHLNLSFDFLLPKVDKIEEWILKEENLFAAFWAGYLDAEGSFTISSKRAIFKVDSCDLEILHQAWRKLHEIGIIFPPPRIVRERGTHVGGVTSTCDLWRLASESKTTLLQMCTLIESYVKHEKRFQDLKALQSNVLQRTKKS